MTNLEVLATGALSTVQDLGRFGYLSSGVGVSGAADRTSARLANRLVGNLSHAAVLEVLFGGLAVRTDGPLLVAVTGAPAQAFVHSQPDGHCSQLRLEAGQILRLDPPPAGVRSYLAVRGGIAVQTVLGSRSTDTLSGIGPPVLRAGDWLPVGADHTDYPPVDFAPVPTMTGDPITVRALLGPRADWFTDPEALADRLWQVSTDSDRVGIRLDGSAAIGRRTDTELASEGLALGSIQIPPSGQPVIFLADHPVTGGYPVIAVVLDADIDRLGQARPGQLVRIVIERH